MVAQSTGDTEDAAFAADPSDWDFGSDNTLTYAWALQGVLSD